MRKLAYVLFMAMMIALLASGCFKMAPTAQLETEEAIFILKNGSIEVKAAKELSGLEVFLKARVEESEVSAKGTCAIVKQFEDGTYIATAIGGMFKSGETVMTIRGGFTDLKKLSIETMGVKLEEEYGPQSQVPENGVYVQDTWVSSNASENKLLIGAKNLNIGDYSDTPINGFSFVVKYHPADIEITNVVNSVSGAKIETIEIDNSTGELNVYVGYPDESGVFIVAPTELLEITFNSKDVKTVSQVTLENVQVTVFDSNSEWNPVDILADATGGFITIGDPKLLGDFNLDGIVGTADLAEFATYYRKTYSDEADPLAYYDIGPAKKAYGGAWENIYTEANPDYGVDLLDLVIMAQNWAVPKPTDFNYVKTLAELNAAIASSEFSPIVLGANIDGSAGISTVSRIVDINLNGYTLTGNLNFNTGDSGTINLYAGTIDGDLTVDAPNATFNNYADVTGTVTINGVSAGTWNEYPNNNTLIWCAAGGTLHIHGGAGQVTFEATGTVYGGSRIENGIVNVPGMVFSGGLPGNMKNIFNATKNSQHDTIQEAIAEANSGDTIFVKEGNYQEVISLNKSLTIQGAGPEATIINGDLNNHSITLSNVSGVTIKDMGFDFGQPTIGLIGKVAIQMNNTNSNINIENCHFKDGYYVTIQGKADNLTVSDCSIANVKSGINLQYGTDLVVENTDISVVAQGDTNDTYCVRFGSETGTANGMSIAGCEFKVDKNGLIATEGTYHSAIIVRAAATGTLAANYSKIFGEVVNLSSASLNAAYNYWGHATGPEEGQIKGTGTVVYDPYYIDEGMSTLSN